MLGLSVILLSPSSIAKSPKAGSNHSGVNQQHEKQVVDLVFNSIERRILREYYEACKDSGSADTNNHGPGKGKWKNKKKNKGMPPGLAKRGGKLPPGLAKRGDKLPPGLAKRLPSTLARRLPPRSLRFRRAVVDNDIVLIDAATNKVLDIVKDLILSAR